MGFDNLTYDSASFDIFGQIINSKRDLQQGEFMIEANYQNYHMFNRNNWIEYNNE